MADCCCCCFFCAWWNSYSCWNDDFLTECYTYLFFCIFSRKSKTALRNRKRAILYIQSFVECFFFFFNIWLSILSLLWFRILFRIWTQIGLVERRTFFFLFLQKFKADFISPKKKNKILHRAHTHWFFFFRDSQIILHRKKKEVIWFLSKNCFEYRIVISLKKKRSMF